MKLITKGYQIGDKLVKEGMVEENDLPSIDKAWKSFLQRFLAKRNIKSQVTHGEAANADIVAAALFFDSEWPDIFSSVDNDPSHVWNMDETGLFWRALPKQILQQADERLPGQQDTQRSTDFLCYIWRMHATLHAIGNSKLPRAVAAVKSTPAYVLNGQWSFNSKAWMNE